MDVLPTGNYSDDLAIAVAQTQRLKGLVLWPGEANVTCKDRCSSTWAQVSRWTGAAMS